MRLEFFNKKERKNCQYFIKALKEIQKYHLKDVQRPLFLTLTSHDLRMTPFITDLHQERLESTCLVVIKNDCFVSEVEEGEEGRIYLIQSFRMLRAVKKNQTKIAFLELRISPEGIIMSFEIESKQLFCEMKVQCERVVGHWPESPSSDRENNFQLVKIGEVSESELESMSMKTCDNLWIEIGEQGLIFRRLKNGKYLEQNKLIMGIDSEFSFNNLKSRLRNRVHINLKGDYLLDHFYQIQKKKKKGRIFLKIVTDPYLPHLIKYSYILSSNNTDSGELQKVIQCYLCEQMGEEGEAAIRNQRVQVRQRQKKEGPSLLKREDGGVEGMRRLVMNHLSEVDEDKRLVEGAFRELRPMGKIEEGEETITRKFQQRF